MPRPIHAVIHQPAIANNLEVARRHAPGSRIWAVVKANAYGHGIRRVFAGLRATDGFGLLDLNEAVLLRDLGWQGPILLLEGFFQPQDVPLIEQYRLTTAIHCDEQLRMLESARPKGPLAIQLKLNTGMNRLGFNPSQYRAAWERARAMPCVGSIVHMTHFSDADGPRGITHQIEAFDAATANLPGEASLSNSAAVLWHPEAHRAWVRPGVILYGASPTGREADIAGVGLQPAMSLHSELIAVQDLQPGDTVGYGSMFTADRPMRVAWWLAAMRTATRAMPPAGANAAPRCSWTACAPNWWAAFPWTCCVSTLRRVRRPRLAVPSRCGARACRSTMSPRPAVRSATS